MNLFNGASKEEYLKKVKNSQKGLGIGMQRRKKKLPTIGRRPMVSAEMSHRIFPLDFTVPFNPFDLDDDTYDFDLRYVFQGSATTGYLAFRDMMRADEAILNKVARITGVSKEVFMSSPEGVISKEEFDAIKNWRQVKCFSAPVFATQFSDRKRLQFPVLHLAECTLNEDGSVDEDEPTGLFWTLYKVESECLSRKVKALKDTYEEGGVNAHLSDKDKAENIKKIWNARLISRPYYKYCLRYLHIVVDDQTETPVKDMMEAYNSGDFIALDAIKLTGYDSVEDIQKKYVGGRRDTHFDYVEVRFANPEIPKSAGDNKGMYAQKVDKSQCSPDESISSKEIGNNYFEDFDIKYREYLDDTEKWNDTIIRSNVREFAEIKDETLMSKFTFDITQYQDMLADPEVRAAFIEAKIDIADIVTKDILGDTLMSEPKSFVKVTAEDKVDNQDIEDLKKSDSEAMSDDFDSFDAIMKAAAPGGKTAEFKAAPSNSLDAIEDEFSSLMG